MVAQHGWIGLGTPARRRRWLGLSARGAGLYRDAAPAFRWIRDAAHARRGRSGECAQRRTTSHFGVLKRTMLQYSSTYESMNSATQQVSIAVLSHHSTAGITDIRHSTHR